MLQLKHMQARQTSVLAGVFINTVMEAHDQFFAEPEEEVRVWRMAVREALTDVIQLWPDHIDDLYNIVKWLDGSENDSWILMRRGVSKYVRRQVIGSLRGAEGNLRRWARRVKYETENRT